MHRTWFFLAAIATVFVSGAQVYGFSMTGFNLSSKLRVASLGAMMRHDVEWFDEEDNSVSEAKAYNGTWTDAQVGALTSGLATLPTMVQGLFGRTLGALIYAATTVIGGSIIGLCYAPCRSKLLN